MSPWTHQSLCTLTSVFYCSPRSTLCSNGIELRNHSSWNNLAASCLRLCTTFPSLHTLLTLSMQGNSICSTQFKWNFFCLVPMSPSSYCFWRRNVLKRRFSWITWSVHWQALDCGPQKEAKSCHLHIPSTRTEYRFRSPNRVTSLFGVSNALLSRLITISDSTALFFSDFHGYFSI